MKFNRSLDWLKESDEDFEEDELDIVDEELNEGLYVDPSNYDKHDDLVDVVDKAGNPQKMTQATYDKNKDSGEFEKKEPEEQPKEDLNSKLKKARNANYGRPSYSDVYDAVKDEKELFNGSKEDFIKLLDSEIGFTRAFTQDQASRMYDEIKEKEPARNDYDSSGYDDYYSGGYNDYYSDYDDYYGRDGRSSYQGRSTTNDYDDYYDSDYNYDNYINKNSLEYKRYLKNKRGYSGDYHDDSSYNDYYGGGYNDYYGGY